MIHLFNYKDPRAIIFDKFRSIEEHADHPLASNYTQAQFRLHEQSQLCYYQDGDKDPTLFSTIYRRSWWPEGAYRVLNRTWQYPRVEKMERDFHDHHYEMLFSQIKWCEAQPNFKIAFISRQKNHRMFEFGMKLLRKRGVVFEQGPKVWVCQGKEEDCHQQVLCYGNLSVFNDWWKPPEVRK